ncbi:serine hydrolase domain-containing protein [Wocania ichthyoenteri]|uniref:serine hydrolase domain-containing protein n=1 Tax=Wocania ichthyoenteri TaxID=1230531 RepID=UPI00069212F7|nr:serine hydrolase domain-containing protein [Wocania ichthyoenteri]
MNRIIATTTLLLLFTIFGCKKDVTENNLNNEITTYIKEQIQIQEIPGIALAVIKDGNLIYEEYFGKADLEKNTLVTKNTLFPVYSITKLAVSTAIFQLIEQHKISLEDVISKYISNLPESWQTIKVEHLLTHSSGLPDFYVKEGTISDTDIWSKLINESLHFDTGNQFEYNQTNYWLLAKIIEKITSQSFEDFIITNQFQKDSSNIIFSSDLSDEFLNRASRHEFNNEKGEYNISKVYGGRRYHAANGMNITLKELVEWNARLDNNHLLGNELKHKMWEPFKFNNKTDEFLHGWHTYSLNNNVSYGFTGGSQTGFRKFINNNLTIIVLTNGYKYFSPHNDIINHVAGIVDSKLVYHKANVQHEIISCFLLKNDEDAIKNYFNVKANNPEQESDKKSSYSFENTLNAVGYLLLQKNNIKKAIKVFKLNIKENPKSSNCYASLAEAYLIDNQLNLSKENCILALELRPKNNYLKSMIETIEKRAKSMETTTTL